MGTFPEVASHATEIEAQLTIAVLAANGIEAHLLRDTAGGMMPFLDPLRGVRVVVAEADERDARAILADQAEER